MLLYLSFREFLVYLLNDLKSFNFIILNSAPSELPILRYVLYLRGTWLL